MTALKQHFAAVPIPVFIHQFVWVVKNSIRIIVTIILSAIHDAVTHRNANTLENVITNAIQTQIVPQQLNAAVRVTVHSKRFVKVIRLKEITAITMMNASRNSVLAMNVEMMLWTFSPNSWCSLS